jgi:hypothetical protein
MASADFDTSSQEISAGGSSGSVACLAVVSRRRVATAARWRQRETEDVGQRAWGSVIVAAITSRRKHRAVRDRGITNAEAKALFGLSGGSLLENRRFRDSWMHVDERLDSAFLERWLGNRQQFTETAGVQAAVKHSIRVIDVEGLATGYHYRGKDGTWDPQPCLR